MIRDSVEYLEFTLTDRDSQDLTGDTVQVTLLTSSDSIDTATWLGCTSLGSGKWRTTTVLTFNATNYPADRYTAYAKVADSPETPIARLGTVTISR